MGITLGTNISSLLARNCLNKTTDKLSTTMERLSTGLRINSASDDAAGLIISKNMDARISSSQQAMNNIQTASNFLTVAEDGMTSISDHLQRINDLLTNMANDTNDVDSRRASAIEIMERLKEADRLANSTSFNGRKMLDGSSGEIYVQIGPDATEDSVLEISAALSNCHISQAGLNVEIPSELNPYSYTYNSKTIYSYDNGKTYVDEAGDPVSVTLDPDDPSKNPISTFDANNANCREYLAKIQEAINSLSTKRGLIGAYENRMDSSYDALSSRVESLQAAETIYTDADIAVEASNLTKLQILEQMGVSVLTVANASQQLALSLLG